MKWDTGDLDGVVDRLRNDRSAWQHQLEDSATVKLRAQGLVESADAACEEARQHIREDTAEIERVTAVIRQRDES